ncbi:hypothetical protein RBB50_004505 [Rhinocladiella similis]
MPLARGKVPEYPRPVSPVPVEDLPICVDTIVYYDEQSDEEWDDEQRAAKKRRIQSHASSYLRGEPIFIATAQLNGPFGKNWRNPWLKTKKNTRQRRSTKRARPATVLKPALQPDRSSFSLQTPLKNTAVQNTVQPPNSRNKLDKQPSRATRDQGASQTHGQGDHNKIRKVEDWLRTNSSYGQAADGLIRSPSPTLRSVHKQTQQKVKKWEAAPIPSQLSEVAPSMSSLVKIDGRGRDHFWPPMDHVQHNQSASSSTLGEHPPKISSPSIPAFWVPVHQEHSRLQHTASAGLSNGDDTRNVTRQHHPVEKSRPTQLRPETHTSKGMTESNAPSTSLHTALEQPPSHAHDIELAALSSETSKVRHTDDLPSAQIQVQPVLHSVPSNLSSNIQLFGDPSDRHKSPVRDLTSDPRLRNKEQMEPHLDHGVASKLEGEAVNDRLSSSPAKVGAKSASIPTMLGSFNKVITAESKSALTEVTKPIISKKKRTAFVTDERSSGSSQGSIKMAMKVAKPSALNQDNTNKIQSLLNADCGESPGENVMDTLSPHQKKPICGMLERKGILKSSLVTSTEVVASSANEAQASTNQDAQRPAKLKAIESATSRLNDDEFDLEGAMDDLGSFLGTWDQQQEAVGLRASG